MSLDWFQTDATWPTPVKYTLSAFNHPGASTTDGEWNDSNLGSLNMLVATAGSKGAIADVAMLHTAKAGDSIQYEAGGTTHTYIVPETRTSPYDTNTTVVSGSVEMTGGSVQVTASVACVGVLVGDELDIEWYNAAGTHVAITLSCVEGESSPGEFQVGTTDEGTAVHLLNALEGLSGLSAEILPGSPDNLITLSSLWNLGLYASAGAESRLVCGVAMRRLTGGNITAIEGQTRFGNATLYDNLIMPSQPGGPTTVLDKVISELSLAPGAFTGAGALTSVGFETSGAMNKGVTFAPKIEMVGAGETIENAILQAAKVMTGTTGTDISALFTAAGSGVFTSGTDPVSAITSNVNAAVSAQQAAAQADEDLAAERLSVSFMRFRGAAYDTGYSSSLALLRGRGVRDRAVQAAQMQLEASKTKADALMRKAEVLYNEMTAKIGAAMGLSDKMTGALSASLQSKIQIATALASEYTRHFGMGFSHISTKGQALAACCQLRDLKVEHELRAKLWDVENIKYQAAIMGAPGAATIPKPSAFQAFSQVVGLGANVLSSGLNIYQALR